ncbi:DUF1622 domain-containing protein [Sphaerospermopsis aphanizomenoides BCCUSP55]|uniref:DUF1622 domain-containing protein n=1 Tax=Sphaerospermopsis aphanizomenoides TaxID=459663 RepID=UPI001908970D|nr:DUF1622 domain-containing protein [Sphaerospermopsis aphanizomenoides]MBK1989581.1 DUF1622 domain-containing protein [Sphaerospermopsis aphanizomenoides BCCUSP55]
MKRQPLGNSFVNILLPVALIFGLILLLSLNVERSQTEAISKSPLEVWLKLIVGYLAAGTEIAAAVVIGSAVFQSILAYIRQLFSRSQQSFNATESIRLKLGRVLVLGLEFTVASDILRTAVAPTRQDILNLGAIVLLRTLLNFFLETEIRQAEESRLQERENIDNSYTATVHDSHDPRITS